MPTSPHPTPPHTSSPLPIPRRHLPQQRHTQIQRRVLSTRTHTRPPPRSLISATHPHPHIKDPLRDQLTLPSLGVLPVLVGGVEDEVAFFQ